MPTPRGPYAAIARAVQEKREAGRLADKARAQRHAVALRAVAADIRALARRTQEIPGTYRIWAYLVDGANQADTLAQEWEAR